MRNDGRDVYVPRAQVSELRMLVSADGLPRGGGRGWELFDTSSFGVSDFVQNVNYRRALQGALERDIGSFDAIEAASVNISTPQRSPFLGDEIAPKASVMVRVRPGRSLAAQNVQAITHLVGRQFGRSARHWLDNQLEPIRSLDHGRHSSWGAAFGSAYDRGGLAESYLHCEWAPSLMDALPASLQPASRPEVTPPPATATALRPSRPRKPLRLVDAPATGGVTALSLRSDARARMGVSGDCGVS